MFIKKSLLIILLACGFVVLVQAEPTPVTAVNVEVKPLVVTLEALGNLESRATPTVAAEVNGKIIKIGADEGETVKKGQLLAELDAEIYLIEQEKAKAALQRLDAVIKNQQRTVKRFEDLVAQQSSAQSELDRVKTEWASLLAERAGEEAQLKEINYRLAKTRILSPIEGAVQQRMVSVGDYAAPGMPLFQLVDAAQLRARLFFPETLAIRLQTGLPVQLNRLVAPEDTVTAAISRWRPMLQSGTRALEVLVNFTNPNNWRPGYSARGVAVLETKENALMVPEICIVQRPAGLVVYKLENDRAVQQIVETGQKENGWVEILSGLQVNDRIAANGAGFLSDGASVVIRAAANETPKEDSP